MTAGVSSSMVLMDGDEVLWCGGDLLGLFRVGERGLGVDGLGDVVEVESAIGDWRSTSSASIRVGSTAAVEAAQKLGSLLTIPFCFSCSCRWADISCD